MGTQDILNENDRNQIFSNLDDILITNDNFYQDLMSNYSRSGSGIGQAFLNHVTIKNYKMIIIIIIHSYIYNICTYKK